MLDFSRPIECTTPLEVELLAALIETRKQLSRLRPPPAQSKAKFRPQVIHSTATPMAPPPEAPAPLVETMEPDHTEPPRVRQTRLDRLPGGQAKIIDIQQAVCHKFGYTITDLRSQRRSYKLAEARHVAVMLCYCLTMHSYPFIGRFFGGRDHTTMLHSVVKLTAVRDHLCSELTTADSVSTWAKHAFDLVMAGRAKDSVGPVKTGNVVMNVSAERAAFEAQSDRRPDVQGS